MASELSAAEALADSVILQSVRILRYVASERNDKDSTLRKLQRELLAQLGAANLATLSPADRAELIRRAQETIRDRYGELADSFDGNMGELAQHTSNWAAQALVAVLPTVMQDAAAVRSLSQAETAAMMDEHLLFGASNRDWWDAQAADLQFRFANALRQGMTQGESNGQIMQRLVADDGVFSVSRRQARSLVQTAIMAVVSEARMATWRANSHVVQGVMQVSTLDGHTSTVCVAYSGGQWSLDGEPINGTALPYNGGCPRHRNCRSVMVPLLHGFKSQGIDLPEMNMTTRASRNGPVPANWSFSDWLERQPESFQDDLLGKGRATLWRAKKITLQDLLDQSGRPLTLDELKELFD